MLKVYGIRFGSADNSSGCNCKICTDLHVLVLIKYLRNGLQILKDENCVIALQKLSRHSHSIDAN